MGPLLAAAGDRLAAYHERLAALVAVDSGSGHVDGLRAAGDLVQAWCLAAGMAVEREPVTDPAARPLGDVLVARRRGTGTRRILLAGHLDTVFPPGTAAARPFRVQDGRAYGPGVSDDKGGVLAGLAAVEVLAALDRHRYGELVLVCTPDEEIGSPGSRPLLRTLGAEADVALCLECARDNGDLVSARKGVADLEVTLRGRAAHAGIEPERGANALLAAARLTVALDQLNGRWPGVTINVGVLEAGGRPNVVADRARMLVDLRAWRVSEYEAALAEIRRLVAQPAVSGVRADLAVHAPTPPWEPGAGGRRLAELAAKVGAGIGVPVAHTATGGCADANLLAEAGTAVLDGLGPVGGADHSPGEWLDLDSVVPRVALLAALIDEVAHAELA
ncbi:MULTISPECIES: M20/M25/M40 family metallo-hydrolase [Micromonospora]|uniref:M20 family peptidase n=1 Tax=Micromonospora solifontis TaxID=2487138 RepID=A0ABX9WMV0_9ACTN|nr:MULTISPECIES: M20/M25/M40 family metallo-hydrolase [Micromonospora]NES14823.1 M20 family metallopeptidase [Micromonospora sp. PPF5-17B]NES35387.1 M20 family metallopeptidase [Micromonospora solifontis]NES56131.1 M20 family metallopeptidase [Micromonospora sp. PPF5-6]RNM00879.1 M20 family peptidase [Micromonospora solifontis]